MPSTLAAGHAGADALRLHRNSSRRFLRVRARARCAPVTPKPRGGTMAALVLLAPGAAASARRADAVVLVEVGDERPHVREFVEHHLAVGSARVYAVLSVGGEREPAAPLDGRGERDAPVVPARRRPRRAPKRAAQSATRPPRHGAADFARGARRGRRAAVDLRHRRRRVRDAGRSVAASSLSSREVRSCWAAPYRRGEALVWRRARPRARAVRRRPFDRALHAARPQGIGWQVCFRSSVLPPPPPPGGADA